MFYSGRPFVRLLFSLLTGIFTARFIPYLQTLSIDFLLAGFLIILCSGIILHLLLSSYRFRWAAGIILGIGVFWAGMSLSLNQIQRTHRELAQANQHIWMARLKSEPIPSPKNMKILLQVQTQADKFHPLIPAYSMLAYIKKDSNSSKLHMGDAILFKGNFLKPEGPKNPEEFNYKNYLNNQGINYTVFIKQDHWKLISKTSTFSLSRIFARLRLTLLQRLKDNGLNGQEYSVAAAILLGDDQLIDPELHQNYAAAGAIHILCVSGMHVGIIFLVFSQLLFFLKKNKLSRFIRGILLLIVIWSYALLTGMSPSVTRAATMISLFIIADGLQGSYDPYNILAASAFLLLVFQPMLLFNVGFQLSYAAVLGIIIVYAPLYRLLYFKQTLLRILWSAIAVSLSAELGVFPLAAHYFHIFPSYFLITNLAVFGLAYLILISGMALLAFSWLSPLAHWLGIILTGFVFLLNKIVVVMAQLPGSVQHDMYFPWFKLVLVYFFLVSIYLFLYKKEPRFMLPLLGSIILLLGFQTYLKALRLNQRRLVAYSIRGHTAVEFINGNKAIMLVDSVAYAQPNLFKYPTDNSRIRWGLKPEYYLLKSDLEGRWFQHHAGLAIFNNRRIFILDPSRPFFPYLSKKIPIDMVVYRGHQLIKLQEIKKSFHFRTVLLDGSTSPWVKRALQKECKTLNINCFDLKRTGSMIFE